MDIELHRALVSHFQQEGLASFLVRDIGAFHDLWTLSGFSRSAIRSFFPIVRHDETPRPTSATSLKVRQLLFRHDSLDVPRLALDAISKTSIRLDGHTLNDGVNHGWINCLTSLWALGLVANVFMQLVGI
ncbi:hypothetical protein [Bradyrhizobium sp. 1]|uniref:hypothetical protein n=1 Tax=Bradyrhizobium sp. 1 TaxID=241591 RepID=UPI001FF763D6|nr:hypothetical protein [Bradyrhizobium sp. 1]MCK1394972.1 hypothetical protein [Bradyrhizobium sp. 1]